MSGRPPGASGSPGLVPGWLDRPRFDSVAEECGWSRRRLAEFYVDGTRDALAQMRAALAAGSTGELRRLAHGCVGSSATCGVQAMSEQCRAIELAALDGEPAAMDEALDRAERIFGQVAAALADG